MRLVIVLLVVISMSSAVSAQQAAASDPNDFLQLAHAISTDTSLAGQWIVLLPTMARQCDMTLDSGRATILINRFTVPEAVDQAADFYATQADYRLKVSWDGAVGRDRSEACRVAESLWGESGTLFPGVLHIDPDRSPRVVSPAAGRP